MMSKRGEPRRGVAEDAAACAGIVSDWLDRTEWILAPPDRNTLLEMLAKGIPLREFWVIGDPVSVYLSFNVETAQIMGLYCRQPGNGCGKVLMDRVKQGRSYLFLRSHAPNTNAHRFYQREGFETVAEGLTDGIDGVPEIKMEWHG